MGPCAPVGIVTFGVGQATPVSGVGESFIVAPLEAHATPQPILIAVQLGLEQLRVACIVTLSHSTNDKFQGCRVRTHAWTSVRPHAHHLIHSSSASLLC